MPLMTMIVMMMMMMITWLPAASATSDEPYIHCLGILAGAAGSGGAMAMVEHHVHPLREQYTDPVLTCAAAPATHDVC